MHQGVFFIAIILIGCLEGKLLHRLIKFMNNNYFIKVYCTIKNLSYYTHFFLLILSLRVVSTELATILLLRNDQRQAEN